MNSSGRKKNKPNIIELSFNKKNIKIFVFDPEGNRTDAIRPIYINYPPLYLEHSNTIFPFNIYDYSEFLGKNIQKEQFYVHWFEGKSEDRNQLIRNFNLSLKDRSEKVFSNTVQRNILNNPNNIYNIYYFISLERDRIQKHVNKLRTNINKILQSKMMIDLVEFIAHIFTNNIYLDYNNPLYFYISDIYKNSENSSVQNIYNLFLRLMTLMDLDVSTFKFIVDISENYEQFNVLTEAMNRGKNKKLEIVPLPKLSILLSKPSKPKLSSPNQTIQKVFTVFSSVDSKNKLLEYKYVDYYENSKMDDCSNCPIGLTLENDNLFSRKFYKNKPSPTIDVFGERKRIYLENDIQILYNKIIQTCQELESISKNIPEYKKPIESFISPLLQFKMLKKIIPIGSILSIINTCLDKMIEMVNDTMQQLTYPTFFKIKKHDKSAELWDIFIQMRERGILIEEELIEEMYCKKYGKYTQMICFLFIFYVRFMDLCRDYRTLIINHSVGIHDAKELIDCLLYGDSKCSENIMAFGVPDYMYHDMPQLNPEWSKFSELLVKPPEYPYHDLDDLDDSNEFDQKRTSSTEIPPPKYSSSSRKSSSSKKSL